MMLLVHVDCTTSHTALNKHTRFAIMSSTGKVASLIAAMDTKAFCSSLCTCCLQLEEWKQWQQAQWLGARLWTLRTLPLLKAII